MGFITFRCGFIVACMWPGESPSRTCCLVQQLRMSLEELLRIQQSLEWFTAFRSAMSRSGWLIVDPSSVTELRRVDG
jgi:hypothetical protein